MMTPLTELMTFADKQGFVFYDGFWYNLNHEGALFTTQDIIKLFNEKTNEHISKKIPN